jgi:Na+-driven multidrug efflux pump
MGPAGVWAGFIVALGLAAMLLVWRFLRQTSPARLASAGKKNPARGRDLRQGGEAQA